MAGAQDRVIRSGKSCAINGAPVAPDSIYFVRLSRHETQKFFRWVPARKAPKLHLHFGHFDVEGRALAYGFPAACPGWFIIIRRNRNTWLLHEACPPLRLREPIVFAVRIAPGQFSA